MCIRDRLKGWQMVKDENAELLIDGEPVQSDYTFTANKEQMEVEVSFTFNASALAGKNLVTFEELYDVTNPDAVSYTHLDVYKRQTYWYVTNTSSVMNKRCTQNGIYFGNKLKIYK